MNIAFYVNTLHMSDGSGTLYEVVTGSGERIATATNLEAAQALQAALNDAVDAWVNVDPSDRVSS